MVKEKAIVNGNALGQILQQPMVAYIWCVSNTMDYDKKLNGMWTCNITSLLDRRIVHLLLQQVIELPFCFRRFYERRQN